MTKIGYKHLQVTSKENKHNLLFLLLILIN